MASLRSVAQAIYIARLRLLRGGMFVAMTYFEHFPQFYSISHFYEQD